MSNLIVRKASEGIVPPAIGANEWDPLRRMREFLSWNPFAEFGGLALADKGPYAFVPPFEVKETKDSYLFKADVPGMKEQDVQITLTGDRLTVAGKREWEQAEKEDTFYTYERSYGSFSRTFIVPNAVSADLARAELKDGVLTIVFPKRPEVKSKTIAIKTAEKARA